MFNSGYFFLYITLVEEIMEKDIFITCPYCGTEYLPSEIYNPKCFFGHPEGVERTYDGKIKASYGKSMDLKEEYKCDCCNKVFYINA